ncbi:MAG: hypothetical protein ACKN87_20880, partial [Microcystis aeruginosa]
IEIQQLSFSFGWLIAGYRYQEGGDIIPLNWFNRGGLRHETDSMSSLERNGIALTLLSLLSPLTLSQKGLALNCNSEDVEFFREKQLKINL